VKLRCFRRIILALTLSFFSSYSFTFGASPTPALLKAKQDAEAKGYVFFATHDEIVERAKKEGQLRVLTGQEPPAMKVMINAFRNKYPFIDIKFKQVVGVEIYQRMLEEMRAGLAKEWDVNYLNWDSYTEFMPYQKKFDILSMVEHRVLQLPPKMVDPVYRNAVALESNMQVVAYNKDQIPRESVPNTVEDFLKVDFKGKKFALDIRSKALPALVPVWGLEKVVQISRKLAAQNPIWYRGDSKALVLMSIGEIGLTYGLNYKTVKRQQGKDVRKLLEYVLTEPIPARLSEATAILAAAANPHAALLWLEFLAGTDGQKLIDELDLAASLLSPGSVHGQLSKGKNVSLVGWDHFQKTGEYEKRIVEAMGFPRAK
jgi:ABC-type Fe3+ transport system substrate-binding protein